GYQIDMDMDLPEEAQLLMVNGNEHLLGIAFANLLENGCKFSGNQTVRVTLKTDRTNVLLVFQDSGIGIPPEDLENIFQPFYRGKNAASNASGHGIGLSLVRRILDLHGATMQVHSTVNEGTRFVVGLPMPG
ncbi:MAG TPA: ATP-binding protein, partial [Bacteroidia bacterium]|nr:ATP-binding protein [Bacteroidia bacterium]